LLLDSQHLHSFEMSVLRLAAWLVLLMLIFLPLERLLAVRPKKFFGKGLGRDLAYFFVNGLVPSLLLAVPLALVAVAAHAVVPYRFQAMVAAWPLWLRVVVGFVIGEIGFYWGHRWAHQIPFLWRFHSIHHSAEDIYFLVSARAHPIDNAFIRLCGLIPAYVFGVASPLTPTGSLIPVMIVLVATGWGFFIHSNLRLRLGPLEWLVATPGFHHWHHTLGERRDANFASMLPCVDKLFGTLYLPRDRWPAAYGIDETLPASLWGQLAYPFRASPAPARTSPAPADAGLLEPSATER
jgi:sterol desaturase/sphingolipid hydroxylase (fatty acid hydroxylase superfamily)